MADKFQRSMKWPGLDDTYYFLPLVSKDDNGKVMTVKDGEWAAGDEQVSFDTEASGETIILDDAADRPLRGLRVLGKTTQNGTPTPDASVPLVSVGDDGAVDVIVAGNNLYNGGDLSFTHNMRVVLEHPLLPGTYNVGALVESEATDASTSRVIFLDANNADSGSANFTRGTRSVVKKVLTKPIYTLTFWAGNNSATSTGNACTWKNIMISRDGAPTDYEPYKGQTLTLSTPNGLPSVGDVCDEIDLERGVYVQRIKRFSLPVAGMDNSDNYPGWNNVDGLRDCVPGGANGLLRSYVQGYLINIGSAVCVATANTSNLLFFYKSALGGLTQTEFKAAYPDLAVEIMMPLFIPIEIPLSAEEIAAYKALTTHYPTTTIYNDEAAEMEVEYVNKNNLDADAVLFRKQTLTDAQKAQILDNIGASSRLQVHDVSVTTSLWVDSALHSDYPYQALIPVNGATSEMCPDVVFDITEALSGNYAPVADAANGGVLIYAKVVPEADIVVPTVTLWK